MQTSKDRHHTQGQPSSEAPLVEAPIEDSASASNASSNGRKVCRDDIELVQNLIERCLQLYMNRGEVVRILSNRARIEPSFTTLVWQKLEEENSEFFRAYYIRLKLKKQIILFNHLLEHQYHLMKYHPVQSNIPLAPIQNGIHHMPVNLPMGYPILPQHPIPMPVIPAPGTFHLSSGTNNMSEMAASSAPATSSTHFPFTPEIPDGTGIDASAVDATFLSDVSRDTIGQFWNFSLSELTMDSTNIQDLGALGDYDGSPFLPSDSDILLDSPEQEDIVEEYLADVANGLCSHQSDLDEEKS